MRPAQQIAVGSHIKYYIRVPPQGVVGEVSFEGGCKTNPVNLRMNKE